MEMCVVVRERQWRCVLLRGRDNGDVCCSERETMEMWVVVRERRWRCVL